MNSVVLRIIEAFFNCIVLKILLVKLYDFYDSMYLASGNVTNNQFLSKRMKLKVNF